MKTQLLITILFMSVAAHGQTKKVMFVCEHGAARSAIASAYFNQLAKEKGLRYNAIFRGVQPDTVLTKGTREGLAADGFDVRGWAPAKVTAIDVQKSDRIVTFDCAVPLPDKKSVDRWDGIPPVSSDYNTARQQIKAKVEKLVEELEKQR